MKVKSYKELDVWKKGIEIADLAYTLISKLPREEKYGLSAQMARSAVSIASNVAEGFARQYNKEFLQYCYIALGSCSELETQLEIVRRRRYVSSDEIHSLAESLDHESRMLMNLIKSLRRKPSSVTIHDPRITTH